MSSAAAFLDPPPLAFAHRGGAASGDENTLAAFARAVALGYRYVEMDVRATADGVPVVFHDPTLLRMTGRPEPVAALRWADLACVRVAGEAAIPRLDEVLGGWPAVRFNIEVKTDDATAATVAAVRRTAAGGRVLLASFDDARLAALRAAVGPHVATSLATREVARLWWASRRWRPTGWPRAGRGGRGDRGVRDDQDGPTATGPARRLPRLAPGAVAVQVPLRFRGLPVVDRRLVDFAHQLGLQVHVWTVDCPDLMRDLLDLGVDGIMTDHVEVLRDVYLSRGHWPGDRPA
ncbi:MAG TPA: glycerophosphodiester phosphodiesterase family protein [Micromonosporaceae bacterium]|nr:glycerophosphodiester phosphodiesterase family protein [Micromonosporaceae bacterium]